MDHPACGFENNNEKSIGVGGGLSGRNFEANYRIKDKQNSNHPDIIKAEVKKRRSSVRQKKVRQKVAINGVGGTMIGGAAGGGIGVAIGGILGLGIPIIGPPIGILVGGAIGAAIGGSGAGGIAVIATHEKEEAKERQMEQYNH